jgi:hypothetical protein
MNAAETTGFVNHLPTCDSRRSATSNAATAAKQMTIDAVVSNARSLSVACTVLES